MSPQVDDLMELSRTVAAYLRAKADAENKFGLCVPYELAQRLETAVALIREQEKNARTA